MERQYELFSYLLNNLIFNFFLKEERDWELITIGCQVNQKT